MEQFEREVAEIEKQRRSVAGFYDGIASVYDDEFENKAEYKIPSILKDLYNKYEIKNGSILDIGCGTGKLKEYIGDDFNYEGVDISPAMAEEAKRRGFDVHVGPFEDVISTFPDKSVDHIVALSSLYFVKDFVLLFREFERVARKSICVSLEHFEPSVIRTMEERGIQIYNHNSLSVENPTELIRDVFLWKRPSTDDKITGDILFKKLS